MKWLLIAMLGFAVVGCSDSDTVANVNGKKISQAEFQQYLASKGVKSKTLSTQKAVLESYAQRIAMANAIESQGVIEMEKIDQQVADYRQQLIMNAYFDKLLSESVNDEAIKNYYNANAEQFEQVKANVAHILFRLRPGMSEEEEKAVKLKAYEASSKLKAGANFGDLAMQTSDDKISAKKGGEMGWIKQGSIDPVFSDTAFKLQPGEISEPVRTAFGYHLIKLQEAPKTVKAEFSAVKGEIRHSLKAKAKQAELDKLTSGYEIEIYEDILAAQ